MMLALSIREDEMKQREPREGDNMKYYPAICHAVDILAIWIVLLFGWCNPEDAKALMREACERLRFANN